MFRLSNPAFKKAIANIGTANEQNITEFTMIMQLMRLQCASSGKNSDSLLVVSKVDYESAIDISS